MLFARRATRRFLFGLCGLTLALSCGPTLVCGEDGAEKVEKTDAGLAEKRLEVMRDYARGLRTSAAVANWPEQVEPTPIFRYDDQTRGYVDGTVWRLGAKGRPLAIITAELHPNYLGSGSCVIYDFLSLSPQPFQVKRRLQVRGPFQAEDSGILWRPPASAVEMQQLPSGPAPAATPAGRLSQMKTLSQRFSATQDLEETDRTLVHLRRLPREIERYVPGQETGQETAENADGGIFLFVNGRNPALVLLIETDGTAWQYGAGRLSAPCTLRLKLDDAEVWSVPPILPGEFVSNAPYTATNVSAKFP